MSEIVKENVHKNHRSRVKERFLKRLDFHDYDPHQVLEIMLFFAIPQKDTNALAHRLIQNFGSLSGVFQADISDLMLVEGVGEHTAVLIKLLGDLKTHIRQEKDCGEAVNSPKRLLEYFKRHPLPRGRAVLLLLNACNQVQNHLYFSLDQGEEELLRLLMKRALESGAVSTIVAYESACMQKDPALDALYGCLCAMLQSIEIKLLDCVHYSDGVLFSYNREAVYHWMSE